VLLREVKKERAREVLMKVLMKVLGKVLGKVRKERRGSCKEEGYKHAQQAGTLLPAEWGPLFLLVCF
jgi:hypothetical protein